MIIAQKTCAFDRIYEVGEVVPDNVVDPKMFKVLVSMGVLSHTNGYNVSDTPIRVNVEDPQSEKPAEPTEELEIPYPLNELKKMRKDNLKEIAESFAVEGIDQMKVDELIEKIYQAETAGI